MQWLLLATVLTTDPVMVERFKDHHQGATVLARECQTGTLLFSQGDCLAVRCYTKSPYTHVAAVVIEDGVAYVYDSAKGSGVRRQSLEDYLSFLCRDEVHVFHPTKAFSSSRCQLFREHLESELGREYGIAHHLTGERAAGLHCAEYVMDALAAASVMNAKQPSRVSPASLVQGILLSGAYEAAKTIEFEPPPKEKGDNRCEQWWIDTKCCTRDCYTKMRGWFLCN